MKKIAIIFLSLLYIVSTSGVVESTFYCCGKRKDVHLFSHLNETNFKKATKKNCCAAQVVIIKVKDNHTSTNTLKINSNQYHPKNNFLKTLFIPFKNEAIVNSSIAFIHAPPLKQNLPVYLNNCVFRV